jgi:hypothetical protein
MRAAIVERTKYFSRTHFYTLIIKMRKSFTYSRKSIFYEKKTKYLSIFAGYQFLRQSLFFSGKRGTAHT